MADRVDVPALLRRAAEEARLQANSEELWYTHTPRTEAVIVLRSDAAYLDRLADAVEAMLDTEAAYKAHDQRGTAFPEAQADVLALLRGGGQP